MSVSISWLSLIGFKRIAIHYYLSNNKSNESIIKNIYCTQKIKPFQFKDKMIMI